MKRFLWQQSRYRTHCHFVFAHVSVRECAASVDEAELPVGVSQAVAVEVGEEWLIASHWWPPLQRLPAPDGHIFIFAFQGIADLEAA